MAFFFYYGMMRHPFFVTIQQHPNFVHLDILT